VKSSSLTPHYDLRSYWEARYITDIIDRPIFEWFQGFVELKEHLEKIIPKKSKILQIGCGNSTLGEDMFEVGYHDIINIDYSREIITHKQQNNVNKLVFLEMDVTELKFEDGTFDYVLDKGTFDAMFCFGEKNNEEMVNKMTKELYRTLKPKGVWVLIAMSELTTQRRNCMVGTEKILFSFEIYQTRIFEQGIPNIYILRKDL